MKKLCSIDEEDNDIYLYRDSGRCLNHLIKVLSYMYHLRGNGFIGSQTSIPRFGPIRPEEASIGNLSSHSISKPS